MKKIQIYKIQKVKYIKKEEIRFFNKIDNFENLCDKYFKKCITCLEKTIKESGISKDKIDNVLIVGGSTRIPKIQEMIKEFFNKKDIILKVIQQDEAIAYGAAIKAYHNFNFIELKI